MDKNGVWGAPYRKMFFLYKNNEAAPIIGYRHMLNHEDLGRVSVPPESGSTITFTVDLPEGLGLDITKAAIQFDGDELSVAANDSVNYTIQIESELGWSPPASYDFEVGGGFSTTAETMTVPSYVRFAAPGFAQFKAVKFETDGRTLYLRTDRRSTMDLYRDGAKVQSVTAEELTATKMLKLEAGTYYGVIYNVADGEGDVTFHLMDTNNQTPTPVISFDKRYPDRGFASITCGRPDAEIHYTIDDPSVTTESAVYNGEVELTRNAVIRAMAIVPGTDIRPSEVAVYEVTDFIVGDPRITFDEQNLYIVIDSDAIEGVRTYYTLDGTDPVELEELLYDGNPITVSEDRRIRARSFKEGYTPSKIVDYEYSHSQYTTLVPLISVEGTTVTLTGQTTDSQVFYAINDNNPANFTLYTAPFEIPGNCTIYAQARSAGRYDSAVVSKVVDTLTVSAPKVEFNTDRMMVVITADGGEGVTTYYTLDDTAPTTESAAYTAPFALDKDTKVRAKSFRDGYNPSEEGVLNYVHADYVVLPPTIVVDGNTVTLTAHTEGSTIYYAIGESDAAKFAEYTAPFTMSGNGTIYAQARKSGMYDSEVVSVAINGRKMPTPQITYADNKMSITCANASAAIYYTTDGSAPTESSAPYGGAFDFDRNGVVKVIAYDPSGNLDPSEIAEHSVSDKKVSSPEVSFDTAQMRVVVTADSREGVRTYYTLDDTAPTTESAAYTAPFAVTGNVRVRAKSFRDGYNPSEEGVLNYVHADYVVLAPTVTVEGATVTLAAQTEGSSLYYAVDESDPAKFAEYNAPFSVDGNCTVYAQARKSGMYDSDVVSTAISVEIPREKMPAPQIAFADNKVSISCVNESAAIYYTTDGTTPSEASTLYQSPFVFDRDGVVKAIAIDPAGNLDPSDVAELTITVEPVIETALPPTISVSGNTATLTAQTEGSELYFAIDNADTEAMALYTGPFTVEDNATIYAQARKEGMYDSGVVRYIVGGTRCGEVEVSYDGRYVTLTAGDPDVEIYYTLGGGSPQTGELYAGSFDAGGLCTVKAIARKSGYNDSNDAEYAVNVYTDENHAETAVAGVLPDGFSWHTELPNDVESYRFSGPLNDTDLAFVGGMESLRHLDMEEVETEALPDSVFAGKSLVSIILPAKMTGYGNGVFHGDSLLSAIVWNADAGIDERLTEGADNPNLLLYVTHPERTQVEGAPARNIVMGNYAAHVELTDGSPFHAPLEFNAGEISYTRNFSKETAIDGCSGWETLTVPFGVQTVSDAIGEATPFAAEEVERKFWLFRPAGTDWERTDAIDAYEPYLIAMPNHPWYESEMVISGNVTFRAENTLVGATPEIGGFPYKGGLEMVANYLPLAAADGIYTVNDDAIEGYQPGSVFAAGLRDVRPFESYLTGASSARYLPIFDSAEVEMLMGHTGMKIWSEDKEICILSGIDAKVRIHDTVGRLVRIADVRAGQVCRVNDLNKGVYLAGSVKLYVK